MQPYAPARANISPTNSLALLKWTRPISAGRTRINNGTTASGRRPWRRAKIKVIGAVSRKGKVVAKVLERINSQTVLDFVHEAISNQVSCLLPSWPGYGDYLRKFPHGTRRSPQTSIRCRRGAQEHIEGFWSILKRGVVGTFHKVSAKHMPLYVADLSSATTMGERRHFRCGYSTLLRRRSRGRRAYLSETGGHLEFYRLRRDFWRNKSIGRGERLKKKRQRKPRQSKNQRRQNPKSEYIAVCGRGVKMGSSHRHWRLSHLNCHRPVLGPTVAD